MTDHTTTEVETPTPTPTIAEQLHNLIVQIVDDAVVNAVDNLEIPDDSHISDLARDEAEDVIDNCTIEVDPVEASISR